jgi:hypothetical protein
LEEDENGQVNDNVNVKQEIEEFVERALYVMVACLKRISRIALCSAHVLILKYKISCTQVFSTAQYSYSYSDHEN